MRFIDVGPKEGLRQFAALLEAEGFDSGRLARMAQVLVAYYGSNEVVRDALRGNLSEFLDLERRWYASLAAGTPDYGVYDEVPYIADNWACWTLYSRGYLRSLERAGLLVEYAGLPVLDLGCGAGLTAAALVELLPGSPVVGTQRATSPQWRLARRMGAAYGFRVSDALPVRAAVVFASEFFEHFPSPVAYLREVLACEPRALFVANTFGPRSTGHFDTYFVDGELLDPRRTARAFDAELVASGYEKVQTPLWNGRPTYWRKTD